MEHIDHLVIGAGVIGLAVTAELSKRFGDSTIVLMEQHEKFGQETSSRNSEVIHSGIYYPTGSLKAILCVEGNKKLYKFCEEWNIPHERTGKLIIAHDKSEIPVLESLMEKARENGVYDLEFLDKNQISRIEPYIKADAAILSPSTSIIDSHQLMAKLEWISQKNGVLLAYQHKVTAIEKVPDGFKVTYHGSDNNYDTIMCKYLINCAGLYSDKIASLGGINIEQEGYKLYPCKGEYFAVNESKSKLVSHLVYPPPLKELKGLGIHVTKSLDGRLRLGPNAYYVDHMDYDVRIEHKTEFYLAAQSYLPFLEESDITPDMSGIRPKLQAEGAPARDFIIRNETDKGLAGLINLIGIESPGLTSCLSIADRVVNLINETRQ